MVRSNILRAYRYSASLNNIEDAQQVALESSNYRHINCLLLQVFILNFLKTKNYSKSKQTKSENKNHNTQFLPQFLNYKLNEDGKQNPTPRKFKCILVSFFFVFQKSNQNQSEPDRILFRVGSIGSSLNMLSPIIFMTGTMQGYHAIIFTFVYRPTCIVFFVSIIFLFLFFVFVTQKTTCIGFSQVG